MMPIQQIAAPVQLPPLILHPFTDRRAPAKLAESSRASLMMRGVLPPGGDTTEEELTRQLLDGRFCEVRMLFYVGKDVVRWIDQCLEQVTRMSLRGQEYAFETFAQLLVEQTPQQVGEKLQSWGVMDYRAIFCRALAMQTLFAEMPEQAQLGRDFLRNYHPYLDGLYAARFRHAEVVRADSSLFAFELYASGEYTRMLEEEWSRHDPAFPAERANEA